jgi:3-deoxy-D-manno-octulosonate 8-phosphate phosphatase (KDO 8-P phosphatase)
MTLQERARAIRLAAFDVDGVMTDGTLYIGSEGEVFKAFNILDGHGLKLLKAEKIAIAIITGRTSGAVEVRARELEIPHVVQGTKDKLEDLRTLAAKLSIGLEQCSFMGDDLADLEAMRHCGLAVAVPNAVAAIRDVAHWTTSAHGGRGAVREFCDRMLAWRGQLAQAAAAKPN